MVSYRLKFCNACWITRVALTQVALESAVMQMYDIAQPGYSSQKMLHRKSTLIA